MNRIRTTLLAIALTTSLFSIAHGDIVPPHISSFHLPITWRSLTVPVYSIVATDDVGVTGYMVKESPSHPSASDPGWRDSAPSTYTFTSDGLKTLYAWVKDAAGNVSTMVGDRVSITVSVAQPAPPPPSPENDLSIWLGQWFKLRMKFDGAPPETAYVKMMTWDSTQGLLEGEIYQFDSSTGKWVSDPFPLHFMRGTAADFLSWSEVSAGDSTSGFVARIRVKGRTLTDSTFKTVGGYSSEMPPGSPAGGVSITGRLIPISEAPIP
jgi:hypothetical protein